VVGCFAASRALDVLNFSLVNGKPIRIMFSHRDPNIRKSGSANVFIKVSILMIESLTLDEIYSLSAE